jgi:hypothetical protein
MALISRRLPHVLTLSDLATILTPTYGEALGVEDDEARERLVRALARAGIADEAYQCLSDALERVQGARTSEDAVMDKLSKGVQKRRGRVKAAPATAALSAVLVRINLEIGLAPEQMRATLDTEKGKAALATGYRELGAHLVKELLK